MAMDDNLREADEQTMREMSSQQLVEKRNALRNLVASGDLSERSTDQQIQEISRIETELRQRGQQTGLS